MNESNTALLERLANIVPKLSNEDKAKLEGFVAGLSFCTNQQSACQATASEKTG